VVNNVAHISLGQGSPNGWLDGGWIGQGCSFHTQEQIQKSFIEITLVQVGRLILRQPGYR
jgi:hypothetical protein